MVRWDKDPVAFITNALSPAQVSYVELSPEDQLATVVVPDRQLSLAIGREGQNARLAAKITEWRIDIRGVTEANEIQRVREAEAVDSASTEETSPVDPTVQDQPIEVEDLSTDVSAVVQATDVSAVVQDSDPIVADVDPTPSTEMADVDVEESVVDSSETDEGLVPDSVTSDWPAGGEVERVEADVQPETELEEHGELVDFSSLLQPRQPEGQPLLRFAEDILPTQSRGGRGRRKGRARPARENRAKPNEPSASGRSVRGTNSSPQSNDAGDSD